MVVVLFPANTPESVKNAVGDLIRDITKDMSPEQVRQFEREWNAAEMNNPLFVRFKNKPYDAISNVAKKRTQKGGKVKKRAIKRKVSKRSKYVDLSKQQSHKFPQTQVVKFKDVIYIKNKQKL